MLDRRNFLRIGVGAATVAATASLTAGGATGSVPTRAAARPAAGTRGRVDWGTLRRHLTGDLVLPTDPAYEQVRKPESRQFDAIRPQAVAMCETTADVATVIRFAGDRGLHVVPRSSGHSFGGYSSTDGVVLDLSRMNAVRVSGAGVRVGSGTQLVDALAALSPYGLMLAGGTCPTVCVGGFVQGGGIGLLTRKAGLSADRMAGAQVVLADGRTVHASRHENTDLYWALRGNGGGNFGVVTRYDLAPVQVSSMVNYNLTWSFDQAQDVLEAWQRWAVTAPWDLGASASVFTPDAATTPPVLAVYGAWFGRPAELDTLLDELVSAAGVPPTARVVAAKSPKDAMLEWYGCADLTIDQCHRTGVNPEAQIPRTNYYRTRNRMFADPVPGIGDLLGTFLADARPGQFRMLYFEALGGQSGVPGRRDTAYVHRTAQLVCGHSIALTSPDYTAEDTAACEQWLGTGYALLDRGSLGESYQNFIDPGLADWRRAYYAENYPRLVAVKEKYDPHRFFHFDRAIG